MKKYFLLSCILVTVTVVGQQPLYRSADHDWNADSLGNHRAVVECKTGGAVARVLIPWRLNIDSMEGRRLIVQDALSGKRVMNAKPGRVDSESGEVYFQPISGQGLYYVYYLCYKNEGRSNYPKGVYRKMDSTAEASWLKMLSSDKSAACRLKEFQSINQLNSFYPMEVAATQQETAALIARNPGRDFLVFPESRMNPIKMKSRLPLKWINSGPERIFNGQADAGEYFAFQLGVYALKDIDRLQVRFSDLKGTGGKVIPAASLSCINQDGIDYAGKPFTKYINVAAHQIQALWCGIKVPLTATAGDYTGTAFVSANDKSVAIRLSMHVTGKLSKSGGEGEPEKQTRLKWLNSTLAQENKVIAPYTALRVTGREVSLLGRKVGIGTAGFPQTIQTYFTEAMTGFQDKPNRVLIAPVQLIPYDGNGQPLIWSNEAWAFTRQEEGTVAWASRNRSGGLQMEVIGSLEFDGYMVYQVTVKALEDVILTNLSLHLPYAASAASYLMGLGQKGGNRPDQLDWKWDVAHKNQDGAWIGGVNAGMQFSLRDERYIRPLNTNFYLQKPLLLPTSWGNENKGGIRIDRSADTVLVNAYSGPLNMKKGDSLFFNFNLLITPFHPLQTDFQWSNRFYHKYDRVDSVKASGATVINIHHATPINPWINYPFIEHQKMKDYIDSAHRLGLKVKIYNTVRELSNHAYETFPLRSLGHEVYSPGKGGGFSWLQEHLGGDYIAAWFVPEIKDAAIINSGISRWHNYYVEGMNWLVQNVGIDGIYLDDVAFDRITMKRVKRVLTADGHPGIIDLHSANQFNKNDGFNNSANLYMEHFPYLNRLWFGEYFDYKNNTPDFFLTEVSGIPFGLMGEMLEGGGNPWRGMVYGMTNRFPWSAEADPRALWKFWDAFGMQGTDMIGYWSAACPVKTSNGKVLATVYKKDRSALIALASWADADTTVQLNVNWDQLGIDRTKAVLIARPIDHFQPQAVFSPADAIPVTKGKGWLLIIQEKE